jgi:hypothetical protein
MTRADALKKLRRVLGPKMGWGEYETGRAGFTLIREGAPDVL